MPTPSRTQPPDVLGRTTFTFTLPAPAAREVRSRARRSGLEIREWLAARIVTALERDCPALHDAGVMEDDGDETEEVDRDLLDEMARQLSLALPSTERPRARGGRRGTTDGHKP